MPTYSYRCTVCGNEFDIKQSFSDEALTVCDQCGGALRKLFSSVGVVFKGSGFYRTDSRSTSASSSPAAAAKESSSGSASSSSGSASSSSSSASSSSSSSSSTSAPAPAAAAN
ncbi:FmdB family zinc ribbon protein [Georgenia ruanii]